jgi:hypothetical protein
VSKRRARGEERWMAGRGYGWDTLVRRSEWIKMVGRWLPFDLTIKSEPKGKKERKKRKFKLS